MTLPRELRDKIYFNIFQSAFDHNQSQHKRTRELHASSAITRVCRTTRAESLPAYKKMTEEYWTQNPLTLRCFEGQITSPMLLEQVLEQNALLSPNLCIKTIRFEIESSDPAGCFSMDEEEEERYIEVSLDDDDGAVEWTCRFGGVQTDETLQWEDEAVVALESEWKEQVFVDELGRLKVVACVRAVAAVAAKASQMTVQSMPWDDEERDEDEDEVYRMEWWCEACGLTHSRGMSMH